MTVSKDEVIRAFKNGGFTINERFPECGFLYFPTRKPFTASNPDQGRVFWTVKEQYVLESVPAEAIEISASWGFPSKRQIVKIVRLLSLYVTYCRQNRPVRATAGK